MFGRAISVAGLVLLVAAAAAWQLFSSGPAHFGALRGYAVVQSFGSPELVLVDRTTNKVAGRIELPFLADRVVVSAGVERIVYANEAERILGIIDISEPTRDVTIELPIAPEALVLSPDGYTLAVADSASRSVSLVSLEDGAVTGTVQDIADPLGMTFSDNSEFLFVSDSAKGKLRAVDVLTAAEYDPISLEFAGKDMKLSAVTRTPNGLYGLVVDSASERMALVNFRTWAQFDTVPLGRDPSRPYGTADGRFMLVANQADRTISVIGTQFLGILATLPGTGHVTGISTGYFETLALVVSDTDETGVLIDLETMTVAASIPMPGNPGVPIADSEGRNIYVPLRDRNELMVFDAFRKEIVATISGVGSEPGAVALAESNNYCH